MRLISYISVGIALSTSLVSGHLRDHKKRYDTAPFSPTSCTTYPPVTTPAGNCSIAGLPNTVFHAITYTSSTTVTTGYRKPTPTADWQIILDKSIEYRFPPDGNVIDGITVYDIDLDSSPKTFQSYATARNNNVNMYLICYFSAGTSERSRSDYPCFNVQPGAADYGCKLHFPLLSRNSCDLRTPCILSFESRLLISYSPKIISPYQKMLI